MASSVKDEGLDNTKAATTLAAKDLLSLDHVPNENQQINCFACGERMTGLFCHNCGQKNDDYRRSIFSLMTEAFTSIFSLESRMWRSWIALIIKPGKVSREFSDGKRTSWTSPVRMYLALSIILFGYMSLTETRILSLRTNIVPAAGLEGPVNTLSDTSVSLDYEFGFFIRQAEIDRLNANTDFERISRLMTGVSSQAFQFQDSLEAFGLVPNDETLKATNIWPTPTEIDQEQDRSPREIALAKYTEKLSEALRAYNQLLARSMTPETIIDQILEFEKNGQKFDLLRELQKSENESLKRSASRSISSLDNALNDLGLARIDLHVLPVETKSSLGFDLDDVRLNGTAITKTDIQRLGDDILKNPALLNEGISKYMPRIMFLMMPFAALIGLIFIRDKQRALLYDHLVHATYIHAVTFALLIILILAVQWTPLTGGSYLFLIAMALYLPISTKTMFKRGWVKTILASYTIAFLYGLTMFIVIAGLTAQSISDALQAGQGLI